MIPLKDNNTSQRFPFVNYLFILVNVGVFVYQLKLGPGLIHFYNQYSLIPSNFIHAISTHNFSPYIFLPFFTSLFLHGGWLHIAGNMLYLWIFGDNVEDKLGHIRYFLFYFLCGLAASATQIYIATASSIPMLGASGAISGVLAAYLIMFPKARVVTLIPIFIFIKVAELPAYLLICFWIILQFFYGFLSLGQQSTAQGGIAWWAHIGGFVCGLILVFPFRKYK